MRKLIEILKPNLEYADGYIPVLLAPMAGITDSAFRRICIEKGCDFTFTEMVSAKGIHYNNAKTKKLLYVSQEERPCGVQLFGHESHILAETAKRLYDSCEGDVRLIDINMGCPAPKITGNGDGSALMRDARLASEIIKTVVKSVPIPISVKFRMGWDEKSINAVEFARMAEESGAAFMTIHGRTRMQMYAGIANWDIIAEAVQKVGIPVIGNGDVFDGDAAIRMLEHTNCAGIMIARGAQGNPFIFEEVRAALNGLEYDVPNERERLDVALRHIADYMENKNSSAFVDMRKHVAWYTKGMYGATELRRQVNNCNGTEELIELIEKFKETFV